MKKKHIPCPTCGTPCKVTYGGLDLVENTGDETLAVRHYMPAPQYRAAPSLLLELRKAHRIISNALNLMTLEQKLKLGRLNERDGVDGEGITRANERESAIASAVIDIDAAEVA